MSACCPADTRQCRAERPPPALPLQTRLIAPPAPSAGGPPHRRLQSSASAASSVFDDVGDLSVMDADPFAFMVGRDGSGGAAARPRDLQDPRQLAPVAEQPEVLSREQQWSVPGQVAVQGQVWAGVAGQPAGPPQAGAGVGGSWSAQQGSSMLHAASSGRLSAMEAGRAQQGMPSPERPLPQQLQGPGALQFQAPLQQPVYGGWQGQQPQQQPAAQGLPASSLSQAAWAGQGAHSQQQQQAAPPFYGASPGAAAASHQPAPHHQGMAPGVHPQMTAVQPVLIGGQWFFPAPPGFAPPTQFVAPQQQAPGAGSWQAQPPQASYAAAQQPLGQQGMLQPGGPAPGEADRPARQWQAPDGQGASPAAAAAAQMEAQNLDSFESPTFGRQRPAVGPPPTDSSSKVWLPAASNVTRLSLQGQSVLGSPVRSPTARNKVNVQPCACAWCDCAHLRLVMWRLVKGLAILWG